MCLVNLTAEETNTDHLPWITGKTSFCALFSAVVVINHKKDCLWILFHKSNIFLKRSTDAFSCLVVIHHEAADSSTSSKQRVERSFRRKPNQTNYL